MLAKCATCNKTFIKKSDETDCPGCIVSGPTAEVPPVKARRGEREIPDLKAAPDVRTKSPGRSRDRAERGEGVPEIERKPVPVRIILGVLMIAGGIGYTVFRYSAGYYSVYGLVLACVGFFNVLTAIYDGSRKKRK